MLPAIDEGVTGMGIGKAFDLITAFCIVIL